jgi:peptide deformylase
MTLRTIITLPDPVLRRKAHKVTDFDKDLQILIEDMVETMRAAPGVGLAAPQVAQSIRLVVVEYGYEEDEDAPKKLFVLLNPEIIEASEEMITGVEGCLSVPGLVGEVERHQKIVIKGLNRFGIQSKVKADGWLARIFQHEIDHLNGILYTDRASKVWTPSEEEETLVAD